MKRFADTPLFATPAADDSIRPITNRPTRLACPLIIAGMFGSLLAGCLPNGNDEGLKPGVTVKTEMQNDPEFGKIRVTTTTAPRTFKSLAFYESGDLCYESYGTYLDSVGIMTYNSFYPSGEIRSSMIREGVPPHYWMRSYAYYQNGQVKERYDTERSLKETWYEDGRRESVSHIPADDPTFAPDWSSAWYRNGQIKEESEWKNGKRDGKWFQWDSLGHQTKREFYKNGTLMQ